MFYIRLSETFEQYAALYLLVLAVLALLLFVGCTFITDKDRELVERTLKDSTGCIYIAGAGGAGMATPGVPLGGGYGQGSITAARSNRPDATASCGPDGAKVE